MCTTTSTTIIERHAVPQVCRRTFTITRFHHMGIDAACRLVQHYSLQSPTSCPAKLHQLQSFDLRPLSCAMRNVSVAYLLHCAHCRKAEQASAGQTRTAVSLKASLMACAASSMDDMSDDEEGGALSIKAGIVAVPPGASPGASTAALVTPTRSRLHAALTDTLGTSTMKQLSFRTPRPTCLDGSVANCHICLQSSQASPPAFQHERYQRADIPNTQAVVGDWL